MKSSNQRYTRPEEWVAWRVNWSAIWVGALAALAAALIFGLLGTVIGATSVKALASWHDVPRIDVAVAILGAFFAFVIGGWVSGKITGARHSEPAILHGVISWLVAVPMLMGFIALGAGSAFGNWYGGFITSPFGAAAASAPPDPNVVRNTALAALTSLLVGLVGSVIGGWIASGEPMTFTHHRTRNAALVAQEGKV